ncbi:hypothetical protein C1H46_001478 [Malus baccata]|uniref:Tf2-1-like SH3-like domain-containing protein n=1 Tax=Malus baccata TaxID=106549 RepID=A0A540NP74_MALBA|nr:hypothetical protein C1H46_001478 [Malus baccata]
MKIQTDKKMSERVFEVGDLVYLRLVPYQLQSLAPHQYHKLQPRYFGPYEVLERIGAVAYKLKLPEDTKIHPVFHVSNLKKKLGTDVVAGATLPQVTDDGLFQAIPKAVLARRMYQKGNVAGVQLLIQWVDRDDSDATWEDYDTFTMQFPEFQV